MTDLKQNAPVEKIMLEELAVSLESTIFELLRKMLIESTGNKRRIKNGIINLIWVFVIFTEYMVQMIPEFSGILKVLWKAISIIKQ